MSYRKAPKYNKHLTELKAIRKLLQVLTDHLQGQGQLSPTSNGPLTITGKSIILHSKVNGKPVGRN